MLSTMNKLIIKFWTIGGKVKILKILRKTRSHAQDQK